MRILVTMACEKCRERNYTTTKNRTKTTDRLSKKKFCPRCNSHTVHKETK